MNFISNWFEHIINEVHISENFIELLFIFFLNYIISPVRVFSCSCILRYFLKYPKFFPFMPCTYTGLMLISRLLFLRYVLFLFELSISLGMLRVYNHKHSRDTSRFLLLSLFLISLFLHHHLCVISFLLCDTAMWDFSVLRCVVQPAEKSKQTLPFVSHKTC